MNAEQQCQPEKRFLQSGCLRCQIPKRVIVTILGFIGLFNVYAMRMNMSVTIVAMVNTNYSLPENNTFLYEECPVENRRIQDSLDFEFKAERYNWDSVIQNQVIVSFFYGYVFTVLIGGYLSERYGGHIIFGGGVFVTSVLTLLTPMSAQWGLVPLLVVRSLAGSGEGVTFPSISSVISRWAPKMERSRMYSIIFSGTLIGNVVTYSVSGWLCSTDFLGGWPSTFYIFGAIGCLWFFVWCIFVYESPFRHPSITADELLLFKDNVSTSKRDLKVPWCSIFTSIPFWAFVLALMGAFFADMIIYTELPTYLSNVLHIDVQIAGLYSAFPSVALCVGSWVSSYIADKLRKKRILSITNIRKIFNSIAGYILGLSLILVPFCGCRAWLVISICSIGMFINGCKYSGFQVSSVDMSPKYAGIVYGIGNTLGAILGIVGPILVGVLTESGGTIANWSKVFYAAGVVSLVTTTIFALFSSAELQPWGKADSEKELNGDETSEQTQNSISHINLTNSKINL